MTTRKYNSVEDMWDQARQEIYYTVWDFALQNSSVVFEMRKDVLSKSTDESKFVNFDQRLVALYNAANELVNHSVDCMLTRDFLHVYLRVVGPSDLADQLSDSIVQ